jgi:hypothetical protein
LPQLVPLVTLPPLSVQTGAPVEQERVPVWHTFVGGHDAPWVQTEHEPVRQTSFEPHPVPSVTLLPVSLHTPVPVEQSIEPTWHALEGVHWAPSVHELHAPPEQTMFVPQDVPSMAFVPVSLQPGVLVEQSSVPVSQALLAGVQAAPVTHGLHTPDSHTSDIPHDAPFGSEVPVSTHTGNPV